MTTTRHPLPIRRRERTDIEPLFRQHPPTSTEDWHADLAIRSGAHTNVTTSGMWILAPVVHDGLRRSLPTFQLGEMGTGWHLTKMAARTGDLHYLEAIRYFVAEEGHRHRGASPARSGMRQRSAPPRWSHGITASSSAPAIRARFVSSGTALDASVPPTLASSTHPAPTDGPSRRT